MLEHKIVVKRIGGVDLSAQGHLQAQIAQLKSITPKKLPIIVLPTPKLVVLSLEQRAGVCAKPVVLVGERVLIGQLIAQSDHSAGVPVHSSVSGVVVAINRPSNHHLLGVSALTISIESDRLDEWFVAKENYADFLNHQPAVIIDYIAQCGLVGLGGAGFPTHAKLTHLKQYHTLMVNSVECEPGICCDNAIVQNNAKQILIGIKILLHLCGANKAIIVIKADKLFAIKALESLNTDNRIYIGHIPPKYASGDERILAKSLLDIDVPSGKHAADTGILCQNVGTVKAVYDAVIEQKPLISRVVTLTGTALNQAQNYQVRLGTPLDEIAKAVPENLLNQSIIYVGGLMMGKQINLPDHAIDKTTNSVFINKPMPITKQQACIRCGQCHEVCPIGLLPQQLYWHTKSEQIDQAIAYNLLDCTQCNCCTIVCPSHIPLTDYFMRGKALYQKQQREQKQADIAKTRFEFRQMRLERNKQERKQLMAEKKAKIQQKMAEDRQKNGGQKDKIQAALKRANQQTKNRQKQ